MAAMVVGGMKWRFRARGAAGAWVPTRSVGTRNEEPRASPAADVGQADLPYNSGQWLKTFSKSPTSSSTSRCAGRRKPAPGEPWYRKLPGFFRARSGTCRPWMTFRSPSPRRNAGPGGRKRLRQDHRRPHAAAADRADRRPHRLRRPRRDAMLSGGELRALRRDMQIVFQDPYQLAQPADDGPRASSKKG